MRPRGVMCWLAAFALLMGGTASAAEQDANLAFVDSQGTREVVEAARSALPTALSYSYDKLDGVTRVAAEVGTRQFADLQADYIAQIRATVTRQRLGVRTEVVEVGVQDLGPDSGRLLVFLEQVSTRGDVNRTSTQGIAAAVELRKVDGQWRLDRVRDVV